jgi:hypothetical protein
MNRSARASLSSPALSSTLAICPQLAVSTAAPVSRSSSTSTRAQLIASSGIWADVACVQAADVERNVVDHPVPCVQQENLEVLLFPSLVRRLLCTRRGKRKAASSRQGLAAFCSVRTPPLAYSMWASTWPWLALCSTSDQWLLPGRPQADQSQPHTKKRFYHTLSRAASGLLSGFSKQKRQPHARTCGGYAIVSPHIYGCMR